MLLMALILLACAPPARAAALRICDTKRAINDSLVPAAAMPAVPADQVTPDPNQGHVADTQAAGG